MSIIVSVRNGSISDTLKSYAEQKAQTIINEYSKITSVRVIMDTQKSRYKAEIILRGKNIDIEAENESYDMYESVDIAAEKVDKQLRRHLDKIQDHNKPAKYPKKKEEKLPDPPEGCEDYIDM
ncbi:MAG: ribosome-associated translation inhibitor RaiA [Victivallales bacterium]|nr:ribosome-associated translation inhibitor RaiA [Victivallales bacterium]